MFSFLKRLFSQPEPKRSRVRTTSPTSFKTEFRRLAEEMWKCQHLESTPYDDLLYSMASIEHEMNHNGGGNWNDGDYGECLETVTEILSTSHEFTSEEVTEVKRRADVIAACGRELSEQGSSSAGLSAEIDYLVARTVEWCRAHPRDSVGKN